VKERPIILSRFEVCGVLSGARTQLRRVIGIDTLRKSATPGYDWTFRGRAPIRSLAQQRRHLGGCWQDLRHDTMLALCPYGAADDRLWVRETWAAVSGHESSRLSAEQDARHHMPWASVAYRADSAWDKNAPKKWRSSGAMPRWASRITFEIAEVRIQRLQEITPADACDEGAADVLESGHPLRAARYEKHGTWAADDRDNVDGPFAGAVAAFATTWDAINAKRAAWASNPRMWVISFLKASRSCACAQHAAYIRAGCGSRVSSKGGDRGEKPTGQKQNSSAAER